MRSDGELVKWYIYEKSEDIKGVIRNRKIEEGWTVPWPREKEQNNKQLSTKHCTENQNWTTQHEPHHKKGRGVNLGAL